MQITIGKSILELVEGDIASQDTDAVVTAAHWKLHGGDGTDGAIHSRGGPKIMEECRRIGACPVGGAVITTGGNLKARHVIHAVGPIYIGDDEGDSDLLRSAYQRSLRLAAAHGLRTISFPSISTGAFGYPMGLAAPIAIRAIRDFLDSENQVVELVRMVVFPEDNSRAYTIYEAAIREVVSSGV
ncbi:MAG TPA: macro domain-containing protein [Chthoniobacter sp.]|jgi:O-acetyl-ADP-ribose deacetylase (regulator of RNase III)